MRPKKSPPTPVGDTDVPTPAPAADEVAELKARLAKLEPAGPLQCQWCGGYEPPAPQIAGQSANNNMRRGPSLIEGRWACSRCSRFGHTRQDVIDAAAADMIHGGTRRRWNGRTAGEWLAELIIPAHESTPEGPVGRRWGHIDVEAVADGWDRLTGRGAHSPATRMFEDVEVRRTVIPGKTFTAKDGTVHSFAPPHPKAERVETETLRTWRQEPAPPLRPDRFPTPKERAAFEMAQEKLAADRAEARRALERTRKQAEIARLQRELEAV